jgi:superfamily II DNA or RNA helicase
VSYEEFIARKLNHVPPCGFDPNGISTSLFPFQQDIARWSLRRGRAAIFASTGLGKTRMQLEWARHIPGDVLALAPLAVAAQTVREGKELGIDVNLCRENDDVKPGINITNYDRLHKFDTSRFMGVVLDESSIIKHHTAKTLQQLLGAFSRTPYRLAATATPSPNDYTELGTHAEFLGVCTRSEMLAEFFVHDGGDTQTWRLKGHARKEFWRWVASWGCLVRDPSDLGYDGESYRLPELKTHLHMIPVDHTQAHAAGFLFVHEASSLMDRRNARRGSLEARCRETAEVVNGDGEQWIVWCDLNDEGRRLADLIDGAVEISGADEADDKERAVLDFIDGKIRVLVSKSSIFGFGLNLQHCSRMAFVGVTDSWEAYHQSVRRIWRFGQKKPCHVHIFASEAEGAVIRNLERKQRDAETMSQELAAETRDAVMAEVRGGVRTVNQYNPNNGMKIPAWLQSEVRP